jgi:hypothetical protein
MRFNDYGLDSSMRYGAESISGDGETFIGHYMGSFSTQSREEIWKLPNYSGNFDQENKRRLEIIVLTHHLYIDEHSSLCSDMWKRGQQSAGKA